ncbi:MAG: bifunctional phosphoribosylaminoimidazolecarboxamide formyltransferase/IMP cyclohydrolase [Pseudomonadota bacterium]
MSTIKQALISVSDKTGVVAFARALAKMGVNILSTGGTAKLLLQNGIQVTEVGDYTGFPEMLDGRVKTLHPKIHAGLLARRDLKAHDATMQQHGLPYIDLLCVNLYPFEQTVAQPHTLEDAIENIDIGGPAMVRSAAKNYRHVAVVTDAADYNAIIAEMQESAGKLSDATHFRLAVAAFSRIAAYDVAISDYLSCLRADGSRVEFPDNGNGRFVKVQDLRYGENPHQSAAFYRDLNPAPGTLATYRQLQGKELSYNNIGDADAAWECVRQFNASACVIVKHANPCGVAVAEDVLSAYQKAFRTDPTSAFGGIIAFNREVDAETADAVSGQFLEVLVAPSYSAAALAVLRKKANVRVLEIPPGNGHNGYEVKRVGSGLLMQSADNKMINRSDLRVVTRRKPTEAELADLLFAWRVAKFVKSNAIVFCKDGMTVGIGAGQMSRVDSTRIAAIKAENAKLSIKGSVVASDAFFPFRDGLDVLAHAGAAAVIQPGGSVRDEEVIAAADEHGIAMVFTGVRHFRH